MTYKYSLFLKISFEKRKVFKCKTFNFKYEKYATFKYEKCDVF